MLYRLIYGNPTMQGCLPEDGSFLTTRFDPGAPLFHLDQQGNRLQDLSLEITDKGTELIRWMDRGPIYGYGDKVGPLNRRGGRYIFQNTDNFTHHPSSDPLYKSLPFSIHLYRDKVVGVFTDFPGYMETDVDTRNDGTIRYFVKDQGFMQYVWETETIETLIQEWIALTGKNAPVPLWAFGYQQSRWGYVNQDQILDTAKTFRDKRFPCDVIYLDIDHMERFKVFTWDPVAFSGKDQMLAQLHSQGFHVSAIIDPGVKVEKDYPVFEEGKDRYFLKDRSGKDFEGAVWPGRTRFPDFLDPIVRKWWAEKVGRLYQQGVDAFWNDMNEIAIFFTEKEVREAIDTLTDLDIDKGINGLIHLNSIAAMGQRSHAEEIVHLDGTSHSVVKNLYGREMIRAAYEGIREVDPKARTFLISRSAYPGIQKYGGVWTGDNHSWWEHILQEIIRIASLGLCGIFYAGCDIGGFSGNCHAELLIRFMQLGSFIPMFRNHAATGTSPQEPWVFGEEVEKIARETVERRYQLMMHLYSQYMQSLIHNRPLIRPLFFDYQADECTWGIEDQFIFGDGIMVAPVYRPGITHRAVYFPEDGLDLNMYQIYPKGWHVVPTPLNRTAHFLLKGHMVFEVPALQHLNDPKWDHVIVRCFGDIANAKLYEDDGLTTQYEQGVYSLREFQFNSGKVEIDTSHKGFTPHPRKWIFLDHTQGGQENGVWETVM